MKTIMASNGALIKVDDDDFDAMSKFKWRINRGGYVVTNITPVRGQPQKTVSMHRMILGLLVSPNPPVDHRDRDPLNNTRINLRVCTTAENNFNQGATKRNTSGYKGVTYHKQTKKWQAAISENRKARYLGLFDTPELAHAAYVEAARQLHGEFAALELTP